MFVRETCFQVHEELVQIVEHRFDTGPDVYDAIRAVHNETPILIFGGHSHIRDCRKCFASFGPNVHLIRLYPTPSPVRRAINVFGEWKIHGDDW